MSIRIALDNPPEFYTNLDVIKGRIILGASRAEPIGAIIVKLEGESKTALAVPANDPTGQQGNPRPSGSVVQENHKILYRVAQVFPPPDMPPLTTPAVLAPGQHSYGFEFKIPFNNGCSDPTAMAKIGGIAGQGGFASGPGIFGLGGIRVMDGSRQLMYSHVTKTLPPSFTGFPRQAEIRYFLKVTIQRPGLFKENWRHQIGFKFMPIEPVRPPKANQEAYARRPFTFRPRSPGLQPGGPSAKRSSFLSGWRSSSNLDLSAGGPATPGSTKSGLIPPSPQSSTPQAVVPPSIEMSARIPHPPILTCNKPIDLRLIAKNLAGANEEVYLTSLEINLIGNTVVRCQDLINTETTRWVVVARHELSIPVSQLGDAVGVETAIPDSLWRDVPLPNTVMPSFITCNLSREYQLEIKVSLSWGKPTTMFKNKSHYNHPSGSIPQTIHLPLHFSAVEVYSGIAPPPQLVKAMRQRPVQAGIRPTPTRPLAPTGAGSRPPQAQQQSFRPPTVPPRPSAQQTANLQAAYDPLYPPQLTPGQDTAPYADAPPSYDEAMAAEMTGPLIPGGSARPAYSGVTNENGPSTIVGGEKR